MWRSVLLWLCLAWVLGARWWCLSFPSAAFVRPSHADGMVPREVRCYLEPGEDRSDSSPASGIQRADSEGGRGDPRSELASFARNPKSGSRLAG